MERKIFTIMKTAEKQKEGMMMRNIFRYMMENGYSPVFEDGYITFSIDENTSVLDLKNGILAVKTFFTIDEDEYDMFLEASNIAMLKSNLMRPVIMDDMTSIMFSCETLCETMTDFKRFFPRLVTLSRNGLQTHKNEMRELLNAADILENKMPANEEMLFETGRSRGKLLS
jgi:hypothetical protein